MNKDTKSILIGGLTLPALLALTQIAVFYSWWVALLVFLTPFVVVNILVIYVGRKKR
jgi:hypothetical protein